MALTGSSFYLILALIMVIQWLSVKPLYPNEDTFMRALGWMLGFSFQPLLLVYVLSSLRFLENVQHVCKDIIRLLTFFSS